MSTSKPNIIIVTYNWPPRNAIGTQRPYAWARYWSAAGAKVTVLTAQKQPFDAPLDLNLPKIAGVNVIETPNINKARILAFASKFTFIRKWARKVQIWRLRKGKPAIDPRLGWVSTARATALELAAKNDIVVSTFGPAAAHLLANEMKQHNPGLLWVADYRDLWSQTPISDRTESNLQEVQEIELATVGVRADVLTAVSHDMCEQLYRLTGKGAKYVPNGFDTDEPVVRHRLATRKSIHAIPLRIVYTGSLIPVHRDPTPILEALYRLRKEGRIRTEDVAIEFYGSRVELAVSLSGNPRYQGFIKIMGHVTRENALKAQEEADILLVLESSTPKARGVLTGKIFEYLAAGRPILCVGSHPTYEIGELLSETRTGRTFPNDGPHGLDEILLATLDGHGLFDDYLPQVDKILTYSRRNLADMMLGIISKKIRES